HDILLELRAQKQRPAGPPAAREPEAPPSASAPEPPHRPRTPLGRRIVYLPRGSDAPGPPLARQSEAATPDDASSESATPTEDTMAAQTGAAADSSVSNDLPSTLVPPADAVAEE